jgi:mRNA interferase MazF
MLKPGDIVTVDFPGVTGVKRRPAVVVSTADYQLHRPDVILGIITSHVADATTPLDYVLQDWAAASLRRSSAFRAFLVTVPATDVRAIGRCSARDWAEVQARLATTIAI